MQCCGRYFVDIKLSMADLHNKLYIWWGMSHITMKSHDRHLYLCDPFIQKMYQSGNFSAHLVINTKLWCWLKFCTLHKWFDRKVDEPVKLDEIPLISMGQCKKDVTPLLMHWSYVFLALTHQHGFIVRDYSLQNKCLTADPDQQNLAFLLYHI